MPNKKERGCRRRSDSILGLSGEEMVPDEQRPRVGQPAKRDHRVVGAGRVDAQAAEAEPSFERALRYVDVLDARSRDRDLAPPYDAPADFDTQIVNTIRLVAVADFGPPVRVPRKESCEERPGERHERWNPERIGSDPRTQNRERDKPRNTRGCDESRDPFQLNDPRIETVVHAVGDP